MARDFGSQPGSDRFIIEILPGRRQILDQQSAHKIEAAHDADQVSLIDHWHALDVAASRDWGSRLQAALRSRYLTWFRNALCRWHPQSLDAPP
jgi:hypothetical protein